MMGQRPCYLVVGLGQTGFSVIRHLSVNPDNEIRVIDSRCNPPYLQKCRHNYPQVAIYPESDMDSALVGVTDVVVSPGVAPHTPLMQKITTVGLRPQTDVELFCKLCVGKVIAITGTNGKSTTTMWLVEVLQQAGYQAYAGGNVGLPVLDLLNTVADYYVLELSSYQLAYCDNLKFDYGCILNVDYDHLDWHLTWSDYVNAKMRIIALSERVVVNGLDKNITSYLADNPVTGVIEFNPEIQESASIAKTVSLCNSENKLCLGYGGDIILAVDKLKLQGWHNFANALAVVALAIELGVDWVALRRGLQSFSGLEHRCKAVVTGHPARWYNDSKATNLASTLAAVESFELQRQQAMILIAGGQAKQSSWAAASEVLPRYVDRIIGFGQVGDIMAQVFANSIPITMVTDLAAAVGEAAKMAGVNDVVLLSPACASFDQYQDFADRGRHFIKLVEDLDAK